MVKLMQAGIWVVAAAWALGGVGLSIMAGIDAWQALSGERGYGLMTGAEMTAYGLATAGASLFILAFTIGGVVGLCALSRYVSREYGYWR